MKPTGRSVPYWMVAPTIGLLLVFFVYPLFIAGKYSLYSWDLLTDPTYVGLGNYRSLAQRGELWRVLSNTLAYSAATVAGSMSIGLCFAIALDRPSRLAALVRGAVFSAYVVSWVAVALLFMWLLDGDTGLVTRLLAGVGLPKRNWLGEPTVALYALAGVTVWKIAGYAMIIFLAGLQDIPPVLHEAAALEGAGPWVRFWRITFPLLRPSATFVGTTSLIMSFQAFDVVRIMTQGGPVHATELFVYAIYEQVFMNLRVGRASALAILFTATILGLTAIQLALFRRRSET